MSEASTKGERDDAPILLGRVVAPPHKESTSEEFYFWAGREVVVEKTQVVYVDCELGGERVRFYGLVNEVFRQGRTGSVAEASDRHDGDLDYEPPLQVPGITYAAVTILRSDPARLTPPTEGAKVFLGGEEEAAVAYAAEEIEPGKELALGVVKNGGTRLAGPGRIDLDYLLGENGGHLNVNGVAGRGTKSSFLLHVIYMLLRKVQREARERPSDPDRLRVVPIILNVKNFDLFSIDRSSTRFDPGRDTPTWAALGISDPAPFTNVTFLAPQARGSSNSVDTGRPGVLPYSWGLADVIERGLFPYLFADDDVQDDNFGSLLRDLETRLTREERQRGEVRRTLNDQDGEVHTFQQLLDWFDKNIESNEFKKHAMPTRRKFQRRLFKVVYDGDGVLRRDEPAGHPLNVISRETCDPKVIDLSALAVAPSMQRFVVGAIFRQLVDERTGGRARRGLRYLVMLDELNRFAPRGQSDPVTRLIETVAAEMRSQGIILLGAQQQASLVSTRVFENSGIKAIGKSGAMEMNREIWKFLGESARRKAAVLEKTEKLLVQDSFREPMLVQVPMPPWALNPHEAGPPSFTSRRRDEYD